jgi:hypothetical protein
MMSARCKEPGGRFRDLTNVATHGVTQVPALKLSLHDHRALRKKRQGIGSGIDCKILLCAHKFSRSKLFPQGKY